MRPLVSPRLSTGFILAILLAALIAAVAWRHLLQLGDANRRVESTLVLRADLAEIYRLAVDAETGMRGYLITGQAEYLAPFEAARDSLPGHLRRLDSLARSRPELQADASELRGLTARQLSYRARVIETARTQGLESARPILLTGEGKAGLDSLRGVVGGMQAAEMRGLRDDQALAARATRNTWMTLAVLSSLALAVVVATYIVGRNQIRRRVLAERELRAWNTALDRRVEERTAEVRLANRALRLLSNCNQELIRATDEPALLHAICALVVRDGGYQLCCVALADDWGAGTLRLRAHAGSAGTGTDLGWALGAGEAEPAGVALRTGRPVTVQHLADHPELPAWQRALREGGLESVTALPLMADAGPFGVLMIGSSREAAFGETELRLLTEMASDLAFGVVTLRARAARERAEADAHRSAAQLGAVFESMQDGVMVFDMKGDTVLLNEAEARINGFASAEEMKRGLAYFSEVYELFTPDGQWLPVNQWPVAKVLRGESVYDWELRGRRTDTGQEWWFSFSGEPVRDRAGRQILAVTITRDVTARHHASAALVASQRVARLGSYRLDALSGLWVGSPVLHELFGITDPAFRPDVQGWLGIVHPDDRESLASYLTDEVLGRGRNFDRTFRILRLGDGAERWVHGLGELEFGADGKPTALVGTIQDITERRRADLALRESELRYVNVVRNIPGTVYRAFADWTVDIVAGAETLTGYTVEQLNARPDGWLSVIHPDDRERVRAECGSLRRAPGSLVQTYRIVQKHGVTRWVEDRKLSLCSPDGVFEEIHGIVYDIQDRKAIEEQLRQAQKMEAVGQLTGGIAHDFNNLLTIIIASAEMIGRSVPEDWTCRDDLAELLTAAKRGATMVAKLLQFSRRNLLTMKPVRPGEAVSRVVGLLRRLLPETIQLDVADRTGPADEILADVGSLEQILLNLCTNARDAMPAGGTLKIECAAAWLDEGYHATHPWVAPGAYICLTVTDTGVGMTEAVQRKVFEPFFTTKPAGHGTGLGLAMVYGLMKQHGGMVHVYSELGRGTAIKLYFPVAPSRGEVATRHPVSDPGAARGGTETILLVEDEAAIRKTTKRALEGRGYTVLVAADGEEALELYGQHKDVITLIVSDLVMPKLGGRQLANALRQSGVTIPILFTSGYSASADAGLAAPIAGAAFLQKPWTLEDLYGQVRMLLDGQSERPGADSA